jgi:hypothetical protein
MGGIGGVLSEVEEALRNLNALYLSTIQITGNVPSQFIDYEIAKKIPTFVDTMTTESERLFALVDKMVEITGEKGENTAMLEKMAIQAQGLAKDPEDIVKELSQLKNNISALGTWIVNISTMPLELDSIMLSADAASLPSPTEGWLEGLVAEVQRFWATFFHSTADLVSADSGEKKKGGMNLGDLAMVAMFTGLVASNVGSYIATWICGLMGRPVKEGVTLFDSTLPLVAVGVSALAMALMTWLVQKKNIRWLDDFSLAGSMLIGMAAVVVVNLLCGTH